MRTRETGIQLSASDIARHLGCKHLTELDRAAAEGRIEPPTWRDPALQLLQKRGLAHEEAYIAELKKSGREVVELRDLDGTTAVERTEQTMREGADIIVQAGLLDGAWHGRADVLLRVEEPSALGSWSYEVLDTKLAQNTRGATILQLCLYSDLVGRLQGRSPRLMHVVKPGFEQESFRFGDYEAYYRRVQRSLEAAVQGTPTNDTYPNPVEQCDICRWWKTCDERRHADDHLCLVAGMQTLHSGELKEQGITTLEEFAVGETALRRRPKRGSVDVFEKLHSQAQVQLDGRREERSIYELLPPEEGRGLARLPRPNAGDVFFDIEADPFVGDEGLEYLLGFAFVESGETVYRSLWGLDVSAEKRAFEQFVDFLTERWKAFPGMYVYHYSPYEPGAMKRLMSRHASRENDVDQLLRGERFVDLLAVVRQGLQASVERYSLKELERFFDFEREVDLRAASAALRRMACALELGAPEEASEEDCAAVELYNKEDCFSTSALRDWLEKLRKDLVASGETVTRPPLKTGETSEHAVDRQTEVQRVFDQLVEGLPEERAEWGKEHHGKWLLAHQLEYFRREDKSAWWEYFRLQDLEPEEVLDERKAVANLRFVDRVGGTDKCPVHRYAFTVQEAAFDAGDKLHEVGSGDAVGTADGVDQSGRTLDIKKTQKTRDLHPVSVFVNERVSPRPLDTSVLNLATSVARDGVSGPGRFRAARDLLLRNPPRLRSHSGGPLRRDGEDVVSAAKRLAHDLDCGVLPIQGPPGTGKTFTGGRVILELARAGKRVGVTAVSHKVVRNLLEEALTAAHEERTKLQVVDKVNAKNSSTPSGLEEVTSPTKALEALGDGKVVGATAWLWARDDAAEMLDYLFVDEAGQMSLAQTLAASRAARNIILLGDPQQLEQPRRGAHPEGADVSALHHILDGRPTIPETRGLFLDETWRLHPSICTFTSDMFYEGRLRSHDGCEKQALIGGRFEGSGLFFVPVEHIGNQNMSAEEAAAVESIIQHLLRSDVSWRNAHGDERALQLEDILVVAPYNAQVGALTDRIAGCRVGTVDKFQGQQAPVVIYSVTSSSAEDAPRGMGFLYDPHRLNVATSRARCACIMVGAPQVFSPDCRTPEQMRWANGFCRYHELADAVHVKDE